MEKYTRNIRFCLICNYLNKILSSLCSRCCVFRLSPLSDDQMLIKLKQICLSESLDIDDNTLGSVIDLSNGDMRRAINVIQSCSNNNRSGEPLKRSDIYMAIGYPDIRDIEMIISLTSNGYFDDACKHLINMIKRQNLLLKDIIKLIFQIIMKISFPENILIDLVIEIGELEYRLTSKVNEELQAGSLVAILITAFDKYKNID